KRILKDGDVLQIGAATRFKVRYLTQSGAIISHMDAGDNASSAAAFCGDDDAMPAVDKGAQARGQPSLFRRPRVLVGLSVYFVCLLVVCMVLSTHESSIPAPAGLSRDDIAKMMEAYVGPESRALDSEPDGKPRRAADPKKERELLARAREAFNTAPVSARSLWTAATRFREARALNAEHAWYDPEDARRFRQANEQLV